MKAGNNRKKLFKTITQWLPIKIRFFSCLVLVWLLITALTGCDSTSSETQFDEGIKTGQFIDSAVGNIAYRTATQSGYTNDNGEFFYRSGETVTFSIGSIDLPGATARGVITPLDLVGVSFANDTQVLNISRLLLSLDTDGNPDNGIQIGEQAHTVASGMSLDFSATDFDMAVVNLVANSGSSTSALVSARQAQQHLEQQLAVLPADSDGDGVIDTQDAFPNDPDESADSDGDGVGDNGDYAPNDPAVQSICQADAPASEKSAAGCDNSAPVAEAGDDQTVGPLVSVPLDTSLSYDADGDQLTTQWDILVLPFGANASITDATTVDARFSGGDREGDYILQLTVTDEFGVTATDQLIITIDKSLPGSLALFFSANLMAATYYFIGYRRKQSPRLQD